jgi:hypothetical protein
MGREIESGYGLGLGFSNELCKGHETETLASTFPRKNRSLAF